MSFIREEDYKRVLDNPKDDYLPCITTIEIETPGKSYKEMLRVCKKLTDNSLYGHDVACLARNPIIFFNSP